MRTCCFPAAWLLVALAATAGAVSPSRADPRGPARPGPGRAMADPLTALPLPDLPPATLRMTADVTGSIPGSATPRTAAGLVPALPLDAASSPAVAASDPEAAATPGLDAFTLATTLAAFAATVPEGGAPGGVGGRQAIRADIAAFYAARNNAPLWIARGRPTPAARSLLERLDRAGDDGLDLRGYAVPVPRDGDPESLARTELALSEAAVAYGRQATGSRVDVARLGGLIDLRPAVADAAMVLSLVPGAADAGEALRNLNPPQPGYAALRDALADLRGRVAPQARDGLAPTLSGKADRGDARVPLVRSRFGLDTAVTEGARDGVQVAAAGSAPPRTALLAAPAALPGGNPRRLERALLANMEEWRWLPRALGPDRIEVNIPAFEARVMRDGAVAHQARVVVGQPDKPTPLFSQRMTFIIVNPYWNVPLSIIRKEMIPKLAADPTYFQDHGYEVVERDGVTTVRQPPGDGNALGRIKFMFPNSHSVYLHDTNARSLFGRDKRALSHGCVRVDRPFAFAEAVLGRRNGWTEARVQKLVGGTERVINLPEPLPIHIVYFTAFVDPKTGLQLRDDVYGTMGRIEGALGLGG